MKKIEKTKKLVLFRKNEDNALIEFWSFKN